MTKSINTPPDKHSGLADKEMRQRMRYIDLIHTEGTLERFVRRSRIIQSVRKTLDTLGFLEIEGPTLHAVAGGAARTHNALDMELYMRIVLELHLKRLLVGGMERFTKSVECTETKGSIRVTTLSSLCSLSSIWRLPLDDGFV